MDKRHDFLRNSLSKLFSKVESEETQIVLDYLMCAHSTYDPDVSFKYFLRRQISAHIHFESGLTIYKWLGKRIFHIETQQGNTGLVIEKDKCSYKFNKTLVLSKLFMNQFYRAMEARLEKY